MIVGGLAIIGITDKKARERSKERLEEQEELQEKIKKLYQEESQAQDEKIKEQAMKLKDLGDRLIAVEAENNMMKKIIGGTDPSSIEYRKRVEATLILVEKLAEVIMANGTKADKTLDAVLKVDKSVLTLAEAISKK